MKRLRSFTLALALIISSQPAFAGFDVPGSADGEDLGRPERPDPADATKKLPADPIGAATRTKMQQALFAKFTERCKTSLGTTKWGTLTPAQQNQAIFDKMCEIYNTRNGANAWQNLPPAQRDPKVNNPDIRNAVQPFVLRDLGCVDWDALTAVKQEETLREKIVIEMIGQAAWDALTPAEKTAKRTSVVDDKIEAARCNVATALSFIACIPQPNPNPLGIPSGADVADCLRKTWEKKRLCIDFISKGAFGSIQPNCAGKPAGCDPDNNPINIALSTFPCKKTDKIYDPELYTLTTTLYHEGIHALQVFAAKPANPGPGGTPAQKEAFIAALLAKLFETSRNECVTHGAENTLIAALCPAIQNTIAGTAFVDDGKNAFLTKVLACFNAIADASEKKDAARAFKKSLNDNKRVNDGALLCYNAYKTIYQNGALTDAQKRARILALRWIKARLRGRLVVAGGDNGIIQQIDFDPATGEEISRDTVTPLDVITDVITVADESALLVVGSELDSGDGVVLAYSDLDGDGFIDPGSGREVLRDFELFGPVDLVPDPTNGELIAVHLQNGNIFAFTEAPGLENFDLLPDILEQVGFLDPNPINGFSQRVVLSEDGNLLMGLPGIEVGVPPVLLPGIPIPQSVFDSGLGQFQPQPSLHPYEFWQITPVLVEANGLPVIDTTSVINQFTNFLLVSGTPGGPFGIQVLPPLPEPPILIGPQTFGPDGRAFVELPPLQPGFALELFVPTEIPSQIPFSIIYQVRDATPRLELPIFIPDQGFSAGLVGIPGMPYQILFSPNLSDPFLPIGDPIIATELPLPLPPILPPAPFQPDLGFFLGQPLVEIP